MAMEQLKEFIFNKIPSPLRDTLVLRAFGFFKIPLLHFISPTVVELTDEKCVVKVPLNRRTKNHLNSMYFGVLSAGADCAGGLAAMRQIQSSGEKIDLIFKDFKAEFLKRAESDVYFTCTEGLEIKNLVAQALNSSDRVAQEVRIVATVPDLLGQEPVAKFTLTLSLKKRTKLT